MAENPLLPHHKLQELYTLMERARNLERKSKRATYPREAMLAAATIHLAPGDALIPAANDTVAPHLAPARKSTIAGAQPFTPTAPPLLVAAATARGLQIAGASGLVLAFAEANTAEPGWTEALTWAQAERLPLIVLCADPTGLSAKQPKRNGLLTSGALHTLSHKLGLPTLIADGEDAVAMFRVMQESALRARTQAGPSVIWAALAAQPEGTPRSAAPLARLRRYMAARDIPLPS